MRSRVLALSFLLALLLALLAAPLSGSSSAAPAKAGPDFHRPTVGSCYDYGLRGLSANSGPQNKVSCEESHRALLIAAPRVSGKIDRKDPEAVFDKIGARCYRALYRTLGGTQESRALTAYSIGYYLPTQAELDKGAQWARCDLLLLGGTKLVALPDPLLPATPDDSTALCLHKNESSTVCAREHRYRATGVVKVQGSTYPGEDRLDRIGQRKCGSRTTGAFVWRYPLEASWKGGKHVVTCFTKTRS